MAIGKAIDYSQARPPLDQVKAAGFSVVYRYVCNDNSEANLPGKRLTPTERDQILAAGLDIGIHGEDRSGAAQGGYSQGKTQGAQWADYAHNVLGAPAGMTIVAAIDYDTLGTYPTVVADYLHGVKDGLAGQYQVGVYGSFYVVQGAMSAGHAVHAVQAVAWSGGNISNYAHLYQHGGTQFTNTDYNDILITPHGTWEQTLMSVNGPEKWDKADWAAIAHNFDTENYPGILDATVSHTLRGWVSANNYRINQELEQSANDASKADVVAVSNKIDALSKAVAALTVLVQQSPALSGTLDVTGQLTVSEKTP